MTGSGSSSMSMPTGTTTTTSDRTKRSPGTGRPTYTPGSPIPPSPTSKSKKPCQQLDAGQCELAGRLGDYIQRRVTDLPVVGHPTGLRICVPRFTLGAIERGTQIFRAWTPALVTEKAKSTLRCTRWILQRFVIDWPSASVIAKAPRVGWDLVNSLALSTPRAIHNDQPGHFDVV